MEENRRWVKGEGTGAVDARVRATSTVAASSLNSRRLGMETRNGTQLLRALELVGHTSQTLCQSTNLLSTLRLLNGIFGVHCRCVQPSYFLLFGSIIIQILILLYNYDHDIKAAGIIFRLPHFLLTMERYDMTFCENLWSCGSHQLREYWTRTQL